MSTPIYKEVAENILAYIRKEQCTGRIPGMLKFAEILHVHHKKLLGHLILQCINSIILMLLF